MAGRRLILASASPARLALLRDAGFRPEVVVSGVDEDGFEAPAAAGLVQILADAKAAAVAAGRSDGLVMGCDSLFELDGVGHGKPADADEARARWRRMRGSEGVLHTGHCLIDAATRHSVTETVSTIVRFADVTDAEIDAYVATGEPLAVAGAFTLQGRSAPFVAAADADPTNVIGLSLPAFRRMLGTLGLTVMDLW